MKKPAKTEATTRVRGAGVFGIVSPGGTMAGAAGSREVSRVFSALAEVVVEHRDTTGGELSQRRAVAVELVEEEDPLVGECV